MTDKIADVSQRQAALVAGISLILMAVSAGFAYGFVFNSLVVPGDAAATTANLAASEALFRAGIFGWLFILILDVVVAWALYVFLRAANQSLSLLTAWLRLSYAALLGAGLLSLVIVLLLAGSADYLSVFDADQVSALVVLFLDAFEGIWGIGLVVFGCHLLLLGYLVLQADYVPGILGILLIIAAAGYLIVSLAELLLPTYATYTAMLELVFTVPMIIGELGFGVWLLIKGGKGSGNEA